MLFALALAAHAAMTRPIVSAPPAPAAPSGTRALLVEPDDGLGALEAQIARAASSIDVVMYELDDPSVEQALARAAARGVRVRVLLCGGLLQPKNVAAEKDLSVHGVSVRWSPDHFAYTHEKAFVFDQATADILTFNLVARYAPTGRDFGVVDDDRADVSAIETTFDADWNGTDVRPPSGADLVWSPGSEPALVSLINSASSSLEIYNEEMADRPVIDALKNAATRGVDVRVVMTYGGAYRRAFQELTAAGVRLRTFAASAPLYIHAKMILADGARAFVGSENFSYTSTHDNRELGLVMTDADVLSRLDEVFVGDWRTARPMNSGARSK